jgi:hypothetical protein
MAELTAKQSCCTAGHQATCCEPSAKADCCGRDEGCGCDAGTAVRPVRADVTTTAGAELREGFRRRDAMAPGAVAETDPGDRP